MNSEKSEYWFPAKNFGWGWGAPTNWKGWAVLLTFIASIIVDSIVFPPPLRPFPFAAWVVIACAILFAICFAKGEPPAWHWGKKEA